MKKAFTTAELLISLVIIGAIASLVVPTIVKDYNTRIRAAAIKDNYANIMAAIERSCADENVTYFSQTGYMKDGTTIKDFVNKYIRGVEKKSFAAGNAYKSISGGSSTGTVDCNGSSTYCYTMQSGAALRAHCYKVGGSPECTFAIDTNGRGEPNRGGVDMFSFVISSDSNEPILSSSTIVCRNSPLGANCIKQLLINDWDLEKLWTETSAPRW